MVMNKNSLAVGIIAEYNPFHNGHAYHIRKAKEMTQADYCIVVMSGDFVQRGAPAIYDKYTRTAMALSCGADLVIEIPSVFASSSAEDFAACGVALLNNLGVAGSLCFGSECGDVEKLSGIASILATEPTVYTKELRKELKKGATFPEARNQALISCGILKNEESSVLVSPNNILGIEYCKALYRQKSPIVPVTLSRKGCGYHDTSLVTEHFSSATGIRKALYDNPDILKDAESALIQVPAAVRQILHPLRYPGYHKGLFKQLTDFLPFEERINRLKTRQYTYTRISRALLHIALGITSHETALGRNAGYAPYARVLGFKKTSANLMGEIKKRGNIPLITKTADARLILSGTAWSMLQRDFYCSHIYQTIVQNKYHIQMKNEFTHSVVIL